MAHFFCLEETGVGRKSQKIDGTVSAIFSAVVAANPRILIVELFEFRLVIKL